MNSKPFAICCGASILALPQGLNSSAYAQDVAQPAPATSDATAASAAPSASSEPSALGDIVVTAQRRSENLQKVPISVSAFGADALANRNVTQLRDLQNVVPGLSINKGLGVLRVFLRGIGNLSVVQGNESSVSVYMDGVFYSRLPSSFFTMRSVERVEVLKGPQGTLFGRNSSGGIIQVITKNPEHDPAIEGSVSYGNFDTIESNLYATTGITDKLAADISLSGRKQGQGFGVNRTTGKRDTYSNYFTARSKLLFEPTDNLEFVLAGFMAWDKSSIGGNVAPGRTRGYVSLPVAPAPLETLPSFWDTNVSDRSDVKQRTNGINLKATMDLSFATLTSLTAYTFNTNHQINDADFGSRSDRVAVYGGPTRLLTQELQLSSPSHSRVTWVGGLYYYRSKSTMDIWLYSPSMLDAGVYSAGLMSSSTQLAKSYAAYGQVTVPILERLKLTGGIRYTHDNTNAYGTVLFGTSILATPLNIGGPPAQVTERKFTYRAAIDYQITDDVLTYTSFSTGYKAGIFNLAPYDPAPNRPESVTAYEVGVKSELLDRKVRLNVAAWWYDIKNPQVQILAATGAASLFSNAEGARSKGIEADATVLVSNALTLNASAAYNEAKYTSYTQAPCAPLNPNPPYGNVVLAQRCDATGHYMPRAPKFTSTLGFQYKIPTGIGEYFLSADWSHNSGFFGQPSNDTRQNAFDMVSARLRYTPNDNLSFSIWGQNLLNEKVFDRLEEFAGPIGSIFEPAPPRTYGVSVDFNF